MFNLSIKYKVVRDFKLDKYRIYIAALSNKIGIFLRFDNSIKLIQKSEKFCLIRYDLDGKPKQPQKNYF
jgi:hypothetical protein